MPLCFREILISTMCIVVDGILSFPTQLDAAEAESDSTFDICLTLNSDGDLETSLAVTLMVNDISAGKTSVMKVTVCITRYNMGTNVNIISI